MVKNDKGMDAIDLLGMGSADLVVGGLFPTQNRYRTFTMSEPYTSDEYRCYTVRYIPVPRWQYPFLVLTPGVWGGLLIAVICLGKVERLTHWPGPQPNISPTVKNVMSV